MAIVQIRSRWNPDQILYTAEVDDSVPSGLRTRAALEQATKARADLTGAYLTGAYLPRADLTGAYLPRADLTGADLRGADLPGADLPGAYLPRADLTGADLTGADLTGAYLTGAYLRGADLTGAYLTGAYLTGADLTGAYLTGDKKLKLIGRRPVFTIGPIGSRSDTLIAFLTDAGIRIRAGCFFGTLDDFRSAINETHGSNEHGREYAAAIVLIEAHAALWLPAAEEAKEAA